MSDSLQYVKWGWVSALSGIHLPNDKVLVKAAVHHSQSLRKKEVTPWVAIHPNKSIIAAHCPCTAGEFNSASPSSAACERLFSTAGLVFVPKRSNLSDSNFDKLVFMKQNGVSSRKWKSSPSKTHQK
ncbi:hypothetical protein OUZ56_017019 [Daphnia magna]|uniref:HAT C-terminal dimerisation domain-containing protein n=1 Tax=Daphnia magna TaxID=35525 RepID=A0ABR0ARY1_9CRUS|nr:hypothetical protein OUZ56_017019 [Daphnia magna]